MERVKKPKTNIRLFVEQQIAELRAKLTGKKVLLAFSGGVDSAVVAGLIHKACPEALTCVYINTGLMRKGESDEIDRVFRKGLGMNIVMVDAGEQFLGALKDVVDPERKRKIIGEQFIRAFEAEAKKIGKVNFLAQGTILADVQESGIGGKLVKSHHNVGGLPSVVDFEEIIEPLKTLYKDDVRRVGLALGLPKPVVFRQPFPGPGLGVRVIGALTREKLDILREVDFIYRDEISKGGWADKIWQYFAVLTNAQTVGMRDGERVFYNTVALRAVHSVDARTADWVRIPYKILEKASKRITTEVNQVTRVVYDITTKPPSTIEWE
jgi:GMP synthase (glutamine-hydrolysing)